MAVICGILDADFVLSCDDKAQGGLENDVLIINRNDVNYASIILSQRLISTTSIPL